MEGKLTTWKDDQGFGFITPRAGGGEVFVHIRAFTHPAPRPRQDDALIFEVVRESDGRLRAHNVSQKGGSRRLHRFRRPRILMATGFLLGVTVLTFSAHLPRGLLPLYLALSGLTGVAYVLDKSAAQRQRRRIPEATLHCLELLGGWPGALLAQDLLRHKTRKRGYQLSFWCIVLLHAAGITLWLATA